MNDYYCKNCNNRIGTWDDIHKYYTNLSYCHIKSKNIDSINFLDCENCKKFIGIICYPICKNCFGEYQIFGKKNLFDWFQQHMKIINYFKNTCKNCNKKKYRVQIWFFEELTFYK